ncbi:hypothetical protein ACRB68_59570 [Actinomadura sp. RB68]|uniref:DDE superfamily endonuclease n=1 Tax=Actinomadura macrotermitis TaxID=2585200 RepID=A0A7K0C343_9ACTN|nr:hypothetical protein [Actinomadura macrotermitis]
MQAAAARAQRLTEQATRAANAASVNSAKAAEDAAGKALKTIRATRPDGAPIYVVLDNLSSNKTPAIRTWSRKNKVELRFTPTGAS